MLGGVFVKNPRTTHETQPRQFGFGWASWFHIKEMFPNRVQGIGEKLLSAAAGNVNNKIMAII